MVIVSVSCAGKKALYILISFIWAVNIKYKLWDIPLLPPWHSEELKCNYKSVAINIYIHVHNLTG